MLEAASNWVVKKVANAGNRVQAAKANVVQCVNAEEEHAIKANKDKV